MLSYLIQTIAGLVTIILTWFLLQFSYHWVGSEINDIITWLGWLNARPSMYWLWRVLITVTLLFIIGLTVSFYMMFGKFIWDRIDTDKLGK